MALTDENIMDIIYSLYETDDTGWDPTSPEYLTARAFCNAAIQDWSMRTTWRDLWTTLSASTQSSPTLVKTITAGDYNYTCPTDFIKLGSWVRTTTTEGINTFWEVKSPEMIGKLSSDTGKFCYITGSIKDGFVLNFNSQVTLTTGDTINYEYYKAPTLLTTTTSTSEIPDPYYLVYYSLARLLKNDAEDFSYEESKAREIMDAMLTNNMAGVWDVSNQIEEPLNLTGGFGY